jgi:hypothetical protein
MRVAIKVAFVIEAIKTPRGGLADTSNQNVIWPVNSCEIRVRIKSAALVGSPGKVIQFVMPA